jgi:ABC-type amino acid transport substrate-binding protein
VLPYCSRHALRKHTVNNSLVAQRECRAFPAFGWKSPVLRMLSRLFLASMLIVLGCSNSYAVETLRIARIPGFPDQTVSSEILKEVYRRLQIPVEFVDVPAKRALLLSSTGSLDGEVARIAEVESQYPSLVRISPPINFIEPSAFSKNIKLTTNGWESLNGHTIGIVQGVGSSERGVKGLPGVQAVSNQTMLLKMLYAERVELAVTDLFSGKIALKELGLDKAIYPLSPPLQKIYIYHYLHETHRALAPKVEAVLREMERSGDLVRLRESLKKQILDNTEPVLSSYPSVNP